MKFSTLSGLAAILALSGCASQTPSAAPSAFGRSAVNSPKRIAAYQATTAEPRVSAVETRIERQVDDLSRQVGELKAYLVMLQASQEEIGSNTGSFSPYPARLANGAKSMVSAPSLRITIGHEAGASKFTLSDDEAMSFVAAAKASGHITIRGRSDGNRLTPKEKALAIDRAVRVKAFLMSQGVAGSAIRITYCTRGCQVADGATLDGQRLNRQTIVELSGPASRHIPAQANRE